MTRAKKKSFIGWTYSESDCVSFNCNWRVYATKKEARCAFGKHIKKVKVTIEELQPTEH